MPQMSPIYWLILMTYFIIMMMILIMFIFFFFSLLSNASISMMKIDNSMNWLW